MVFDSFESVMMAVIDKNSPFHVPQDDFNMIAVKGTKNGIKNIDGHLVPMPCRSLRVVKSMEVREDDTFVIAFPKSGNN